MNPPSDSIARKLVRHGGTYAAARLVQRGLALAMVPIYAYYLAPAGYGVVALLASIEPLMTVVFSQGLLASWVRLRLHGKDDDERRRLESTIFWYLAATTAVLLALAVAFGERWLGGLAPGVPFRPLVALALTNAAIRLFSELYLRRLQADGHPRAFARFATLRALATTAAVAWAIAGLESGVEGKLWAELAVVAVSTAIAVALIRPRLQFDASLLRASFAYGVPLLPHVLMGTLQGAVSRVLITYTLGIAATGIFSMGFAIANVASLAAVALNQAFLPLFHRSVQASKAAGAMSSHEVGRAGCLLVAVVGMVGLGLTAGARELVAVLATPEFGEAWKMVAPLCGAIVFQGMYFVFAQSVLFETAGAQRIVWASGLSVVANAAVCVVGLPLLGIMAAALAMLVANAVLAGVTFALGRSRVPVPYAWPRWVAALGVTTVGLLAIFSADLRLDEVVVRVPAKLAIAVLGAAALARIAELSPSMVAGREVVGAR